MRSGLSKVAALYALAVIAGFCLVSAPAEAQEFVPGERLDPSLYGPSYVETMQAAIDRDRLARPVEDGKIRQGQPGEWVVPSRRATSYPRSGVHNAVNKWGDPHMAIGFPGRVDVYGAYFAGQAAEGAWAPGIQIIGYRDGQRVAETGWFYDIGPEPTWFDMKLHDVDRIEIVAIPALDGSAWYGLDDLTYAPLGPKGEPGKPVVVDFEDLDYNTTLTGSGYAGLTWERGRGEYVEDTSIHPPQVPPGHKRDVSEGGATAAERSGTRAATPLIVTSFQGVIRGDGGSNSYPPDTDGAVGPDHFVVTVNRNFSVYEKDTGTRVINMGLGSFLPGSSGDPRVLFDQHSQRWIVAVDDFESRLYLAVSMTDDPTGSWFKTSFVMSAGSDAGTWPDYPTLGVDANGIYSAAYMVGSNGMSIFAIDKAPLVDPSPSLGTVTAFRNQPWEGAIQPAHTYGDPGVEYLVSVKDSNELRIRAIYPPLTSPSMAVLGTVSVPSFSGPPDAPALGSDTPLDTVGDRLMMAVYRDGSLWTAHTIADGSRAACRWYEINPSQLSLIQSGTVAQAGMWFYFPSIMVNQYGGVVMAFTGSNPTMYASCYYTGRMAGDPPGEMATPVMYKEGTGPQNNIDYYGRNRWGDYSYTTLDPVDFTTFWTIQEYGHANNIWGTYIAALTLNDGDCNQNGIPDVCDITCGAPGDYCDIPGCGGSSDCNLNGVPDECEDDCNGNGAPDDCDIADGTSSDCNGNGVPDECDIAQGTSQDCQGNGIPDECDLAPPADVTAADACGSAALVCPGITFTGTTSGATNDGSAGCGEADSAPDVWYYYEPAGNGYVTVSLCGSSYDTVLSVHESCPGTAANVIACNDDYCNEQSQVSFLAFLGQTYWIRISGKAGATGDFELLVTGPDCLYSVECNDNGIPDECEPDCNENGQPDDCDIAQGLSQDADGSGIPDECEGCGGQLLGDANCDGVVNAFDIDAFILALTDAAAWDAQYGGGTGCTLLCTSDCNQDGEVNAFDIDPFIAILTGK